MDFAAALEKAISVARRRSLLMAAAATAGGVVFAVATAAWVNLVYPVIALIIVAGTWSIALTGGSGVRALKSLRGAQPEHWLPSPSHGVLVVAGDHLVAGGIPRAELNRHAMRRVASISFDESAHALTVDVMTIVRTDDGEREDQRRALVKLDPAITPQRAYAFAKHVLVLSSR